MALQPARSFETADDINMKKSKIISNYSAMESAAAELTT